MSLKKTVMIAIVFAVILGVYWMDQNRIREQEAQTEREARLVGPAREAIDRITIESNGETIELAHVGGEDWRMLEPLDRRADPDAVAELLRRIDEAQRGEPFEVTGDRLAEFGLDERPIGLAIEADGLDAPLELSIGDTTPDGEAVYVREDALSEVFTTEAALRGPLLKGPDQLRDQRLAPIDFNQATTATLNYGGRTLEFHQAEGEWLMGDGRPADEEALAALLRALDDADATGFIDEPPIDPARYGLESPWWVGIFEAENAGPVTLLVGDEVSTTTGRRWAMHRGDPYVYSIARDLAQAIAPNPNDLRSKALFTLEPWEVGRASFRARGTEFLLERDENGRWRLADEPDLPLDQSTVSRKVSGLASLEAERFITEAPGDDVTGLDEPILVATLWSNDGATSETVAPGKQSAEGPYVYASWRGELIGVHWEEPGKFFLTRDELIDKQMTDLDPESVESLELREGDRAFTLQRLESGAWRGRPEGSDAAYQVEGPRVTTLLYSVAALEWKRRLRPAESETDQTLVKTMELENPPRELVLRDAEGVELARLGIGGEQTKSIYVALDGRYYAIDRMRMQPVSDATNVLLGDLNPAAE